MQAQTNRENTIVNLYRTFSGHCSVLNRRLSRRSDEDLERCILSNLGRVLVEGRETEIY